MAGKRGEDPNNSDFQKAYEDALSNGGMEITELDQLAISTSELYNAYIEKEFSPAQALYLASVTITGNPGIAPPR